ncbi:MAG: ribosome silencing factor [Parachlamydiaceae bacterium]
MNKTNESLKLLDVISQTIFDKKGMNIIALDVRGISTMADYYLIAEGNVERHVKAIHHAILDAMQQHGHKVLYVEGARESDWIVVDFGDIVIHLFIPDLREKYALESLWKEGKVVDVKINTEKPVLPV